MRPRVHDRGVARGGVLLPSVQVLRDAVAVVSPVCVVVSFYEESFFSPCLGGYKAYCCH